MDELRKNHILQIDTKNGEKIRGTVIDFAPDRILVRVDDGFVQNAKKLRELDDLSVLAKTHFGLKKMTSCVINELDVNNCIIIENAKAHPVEQKREHVRVSCSFMFSVQADNQFYKCNCLNISAGGIAFNSPDREFSTGESVKILLPESDFSKLIAANVEIIKAEEDYYVGKYLDLDEYDENKIVKRIFELLASK